MEPWDLKAKVIKSAEDVKGDYQRGCDIALYYRL
jgi:hypothetical protein